MIHTRTHEFKPRAKHMFSLFHFDRPPMSCTRFFDHPGELYKLKWFIHTFHTHSLPCGANAMQVQQSGCHAIAMVSQSTPGCNALPTYGMPSSTMCGCVSNLLKPSCYSACPSWNRTQPQSGGGGMVQTWCNHAHVHGCNHAQRGMMHLHTCPGDAATGA